MKEFGSDFHFIESNGLIENTIHSYHPSALYYADGRQALISLYKHQGWKRIWVPEYFCYEVISSLYEEGISIAFYMDYPGADDDISIKGIPFEKGDALLRVNYMGIRFFRSNVSINVPVVEDHTHDLIGSWAINSDADWCIASLRKSLPVAEGGILWSPRGHMLPSEPCHSEENEAIAVRRWLAMKWKSYYLLGEAVEKSQFRNELIATERYFDSSNVSMIDKITRDYLKSFNIHDWYMKKSINWMELKSISTSRFEVLLPEDSECNIFSFTILCHSAEYRDHIKNLLIRKSIYPAILWHVSDNASSIVREFSSRMISIHCDARYSIEDIRQMKSIIESVL